MRIQLLPDVIDAFPLLLTMSPLPTTQVTVVNHSCRRRLMKLKFLILIMRYRKSKIIKSREISPFQGRGERFQRFPFNRLLPLWQYDQRRHVIIYKNIEVCRIVNNLWNIIYSLFITVVLFLLKMQNIVINVQSKFFDNFAHFNAFIYKKIR